MVHKPDEVAREYPPIGKYRVRLLKNGDDANTLDIREYVEADSFSGFTRRGIRLSDRAQMDLLRDILTEILAIGKSSKPRRRKGGRK